MRASERRGESDARATVAECTYYATDEATGEVNAHALVCALEADAARDPWARLVGTLGERAYEHIAARNLMGHALREAIDAYRRGYLRALREEIDRERA